MTFRLVITCLLSLLAAGPLLGASQPIRVTQADWPGWRGLTRDGKAAPGQDIPVQFGPEENVIWKRNIPGRGHASPTVVGKRVYLATSDPADRTQSVLALDRWSGEVVWEKIVNRGSLPEKIHNKNSHATSTVSCDGDRIFATFYNKDAIEVAALDLNGNIVWEKWLGPFLPKKFLFGYGASATLYKDWVIVVGDYEEGGFLAALERDSGTVAWRTTRPKEPNYSSPIVGHVAGQDQLLISGCKIVAAYHPETGKELWSTPAIAPQTCGTLVWEGDLVFGSGGYPAQETVAIRADGSGEVVWRNTQKCYEQSMLAHDGYLYAVTDNGVAYCWRTRDGEEMWSERLKGPFSSSPVLVAGRIYVANEKGTFFVFKAMADTFDLLATNQLGDEAFATPAICDNRIYARVAHGTDKERQEVLYCIGAPSPPPAAGSAP